MLFKPFIRSQRLFSSKIPIKYEPVGCNCGDTTHKG